MNERLSFIGTITMAASRLGIFGRFHKDHFVWFDPATQNLWPTTPAQDKISILFNACLSLRNYLSWTYQPQNT